MAQVIKPTNVKPQQEQDGPTSITWEYKGKHGTHMTEMYNTAKIIWWETRERHAGDQMGSQ